ncbi:hypothetical protein G7Y41_05780 [Schaalia sp. ZJ405]|uniref:hypothetical protein n=1 Tax=Schaalia sp. ZJ405 TaxID=2709403 RepID=UPI0013E9CD6A|nr:hypothetical protein [Schaalia sp. ZJ405]QPK80610.1 hypothetical protein G7Y41_05780 [Schaalia sp. ZJ405]
MERLKQYTSALAVAVAAMICLIIGILSVTVLKPAHELSSSTVSPTAITMTRNGVLPLIDSKVTVTAASASGQDVVLALGTVSDVTGWIGSDAYTEVVGISSDRSQLKIEEHRGAPDDRNAQSGAQSGMVAKSNDTLEKMRESARTTARSGDAGSGENAQSGASSSSGNPAAAELVALASESDMWLQSATHASRASLTIDDIPDGRSILAISAGGAEDLTLTLTWQTRQANVVAIISFLLAGVLAVIAVILAIGRARTLRSREERAEKLASQAGADITETQSIDTAQVASMVAGTHESDEPSTNGAEDEDEPSSASTMSQLDDSSVENESSDDAGDDQDDEHRSDDTDQTRDVVEAEQDHATESDRPFEAEEDDAPADDQVSMDDATALQDEAPTTVEDSEADAEQPQGRHGKIDGPRDEDPPETVPTDTGIIDVSAIRPGMVFPSRRAIREAREKGQDKIIIEGREFTTGLILVIDAEKPASSSSPETPDSEQTAKRGVFGRIFGGKNQAVDEGDQ